VPDDLRTCLDATGLLIVREIYRACEMLGADPGLLSAIGSWGRHTRRCRDPKNAEVVE
jgi:hypothetical protein